MLAHCWGNGSASWALVSQRVRGAFLLMHLWLQQWQWRHHDSDIPLSSLCGAWGLKVQDWPLCLNFSILNGRKSCYHCLLPVIGSMQHCCPWLHMWRTQEVAHWPERCFIMVMGGDGGGVCVKAQWWTRENPPHTHTQLFPHSTLQQKKKNSGWGNISGWGIGALGWTSKFCFCTDGMTKILGQTISAKKHQMGGERWDGGPPWRIEIPLLGLFFSTMAKKRLDPRSPVV